MLTFAEAARRPEPEVGAELAQLAAHGAHGMLVPAAFEEAYYLNFNLPEQLGRLFSGINPARINEDTLEGLCEQAQQLVRTSVLINDAVQLFYRALGNAGLNTGTVHARRPGTRYAEEAAHVIPPGTAALHAVKRLWGRDWSFEQVLARLDNTGGIGIEARPTLLLAGPPGQPDAALAREYGVQTALVNHTGLVGLPE
ncbi:hypothetical protein [Deinococcus sp.]|uniref:hypothetical protein n=1 Tax=Deinococcus sp. TaxID=47478 RepID=UPI0025C6FBFD|nr:hypothetical protein [Deinococcus sp.]